mgnify:CR=1 FL=1
MGHHDLIFSGARIVSGGKTKLIDIAIQGEKISALGAPGTLGSAKKIFDVKGKYIIPGAIDVCMCIFVNQVILIKKIGTQEPRRLLWAE